MSTAASLCFAVDGVWADWTMWGNCDVSCDYGNETRNRTCVGPFYSGKECEGSSVDIRSCFNQPCQSKTLISPPQGVFSHPNECGLYVSGRISEVCSFYFVCHL